MQSRNFLFFQQTFGVCHSEPVRSASNGPERSEGAQGKLREESRSAPVTTKSHGEIPRRFAPRNDMGFGCGSAALRYEKLQCFIATMDGACGPTGVFAVQRKVGLAGGLPRSPQRFPARAVAFAYPE